jgi:hypothetical protein
MGYFYHVFIETSPSGFKIENIEYPVTVCLLPQREFNSKRSSVLAVLLSPLILLKP